MCVATDSSRSTQKSSSLNVTAVGGEERKKVGGNKSSRNTERERIDGFFSFFFPPSDGGGLWAYNGIQDRENGDGCMSPVTVDRLPLLRTWSLWILLFFFLSLGRRKKKNCTRNTLTYIYISYTHFLFAPLEEQRPYSFRDGGREEKMKRNEMTRETPCYV